MHEINTNRAAFIAATKAHGSSNARAFASALAQAARFCEGGAIAAMESVLSKMDEKKNENEGGANA